jgi:hypothetical protein
VKKFSAQAICEADWINRSAKWDGNRLTSLQMPVRLADPEIEQCAWCGEPTILGAYVRVETATVPHPTIKDDE